MTYVVGALVIVVTIQAVTLVASPYCGAVKSECSVALLADRHHGLRDSVRGLLETEFDTVFMVADEASLLEGLGRLRPAIVIVDLSLSRATWVGLERVRMRSSVSKVVMQYLSAGIFK